MEDESLRSDHSRRLLEELQRQDKTFDVTAATLICRNNEKIQVDPLILASLSPLFVEERDDESSSSSFFSSLLSKITIIVPDLQRSDVSLFLSALFDWNFTPTSSQQDALFRVASVLYIDLDPFKVSLNEDLYRCHSCDKRFLVEKSLKRHVRLVHGEPSESLRCRICSRMCRSNSELIVHTRIHTKEKPFRCHLCEKRFTQRSQLNDHVNNVHHKKKKTLQPICDICGLHFSSKAAVKRHAKIHERPHLQELVNSDIEEEEDDDDDEEEEDEEEVEEEEENEEEEEEEKEEDEEEEEESKVEEEDEEREEQKKEAEEGEEDDSENVDPTKKKKPFECSVCRKRFTQKSHLTVHEKAVHHRVKLNMCPHCGKTFSVASNMKTHMLIHERQRKEDEEEDWAIVGAYDRKNSDQHVCEFCGRTYAKFSDLQIHIKTHAVSLSSASVSNSMISSSSASLLNCRDCDQTFSSTSQLQIHEKIHTGETQYVCSTCSRSCVSKSALEKHILIHTGLRPHQCSQCGKRFVQRSHLNYHVKTVHDDNRIPRPKTHFCPYCEKGFSNSSSLNKHIKTHNKERNFKCSECDKSFIQKAHLKTHMMKHTGEKPFPCETCGRSFVTKSNLKEHSKLHSGEKKFYACSACPARYANVSDLRIHTRKHSGETPFSCPFCERGFRSKRHLGYHIRTHTGQKPFHCKNCNKSFAAPAGLRQHFNRHGTCRLTASSGAYSIKCGAATTTTSTGELVNDQFKDLEFMYEEKDVHQEERDKEEAVLIDFTPVAILSDVEDPTSGLLMTQAEEEDPFVVQN